MATVKLIEDADASAEVRAVYDDIMAIRKVDREQLLAVLTHFRLLLCCGRTGGLHGRAHQRKAGGRRAFRTEFKRTTV